MARLSSYSLLAIALSKLVIASPLLLRRQTVTIPSNVANGTITTGCGAFHTVLLGETCLTIEEQFDITDALFHTLNPEVNSGCTNLVAGEAYCVQSAGGGNAPVPAPGTIVQGCTQFFIVGANDSCSSIESQFGISDILFKIMNPEIDAACDNLIDGSAYCVQTSNLTNIPSNVSPGTITSGCVRYFTVSEGESCPDIESQADISLALFHALNPQVNSACSNLIAGEAYCVASINSTIVTVPDNVATGTITSGCTEFHTIVSGDTCPSISAQFNISSVAFQALNPEIDNNCDNLLLGEAYCVQSSNPLPTTPPSNVASGTITAKCAEYFTVQSGQSCATVETMFGITLAFFQSLNPEINDECTNILAGEAYCVQSTGSA